MAKRSRIALVLIFGAFAICAAYMLSLGRNVRFGDISIDGERLAEIKESRQRSGSGLIESLSFDGQELFFDTTSDIFYYSLEEDSSTAYNPSVGLAADGSVSLAVLDAQITQEDIKAGRTYSLIAYNDDVYYEYGLKCTTLPLMNIDCASEIGDEDVSMYMTLYDNSTGAVQRVTQSNGNIHIRGGSTRSYPKKGYKLSLTKAEDSEKKNKLTLLGLRQDDDWVLYAAYNDQEKIRNVFSTNLWKYTCAQDNALGIDNGVEYKYIELFINHEYWGLYALGYKVDEKQLGIDTDLGERLYKKISWESEEFILPAQNAPVVGYDTDEALEDAWGALKNYYRTLHLYWEDSERMYAGIDIDNAIDMYLFINLIQGMDHTGGSGSNLSIKNMYLSFHNVNGKEVMLYTPWDMDLTWGEYSSGSSQNTVMGLGNLEALILNGDDDVWELILTKYWTLRENLWSEEYLNTLLDGYEDDIYGSGGVLRDMERWPDGSYGAADKGLDDFRSYVSERLKEMDDYYRRVEAIALDDNPAKNIYIIRSAQYKDFLTSDLRLEITDKKVLEEADYREFFEYIGIDMNELTDGINLVLINGAEKSIEYLEASNVSESQTNAGGGLRREAYHSVRGECYGI